MQLFAVNFTQRPQTESNCKHRHKLRNLDVRFQCADVQIQTVAAHAFDYKTNDTVVDSVKSSNPTQFVPFAAGKHQHTNKETDKRTKTFVKECCLVPPRLTAAKRGTCVIDPHRREVETVHFATVDTLEEVGHCRVVGCNQITEGFLIGEVAPTSDTLRKQHARQNAVYNYAEVLFLAFTQQVCHNIAYNNTAVNAKSAAAEIEIG